MVRRKLGQHFLIDRNVADREIAYADISTNDVVLEIGPGKGVLTYLLAEKAHHVIAVEIDPSLKEQLQPHLPNNVTLILGDALQVDFRTLPPFTKIVANLPFAISSPITFQLLSIPFSKAVMIYQKDFAERMVASPGSREYSRLSVHVYYKAQCRILEDIPRTCFSPPPKVDASIVEVIPRQTPAFQVPDESFFLNLTRELFSHRRKKIKNTLEKSYHVEDISPYGECRVETLTPEQICELSFLLYNRIYHEK